MDNKSWSAVARHTLFTLCFVAHRNVLKDTRLQTAGKSNEGVDEKMQLWEVCCFIGNSLLIFMEGKLTDLERIIGGIWKLTK